MCNQPARFGLAAAEQIISTGRADSVLFIIIPPAYIECRLRRAG